MAKELATFPEKEEISTEEKEQILMTAQSLYEEYLEKINQEKMTADEAMDDVERKSESGKISDEIKEEVIKKLMILADQEKLAA
ncbi:MAG: hypothetical protein V1892_00665 [bacterium]